MASTIVDVKGLVKTYKQGKVEVHVCRAGDVRKPPRFNAPRRSGS